MPFRGADIQVALPRFDPSTSVLKLLSESLCRHGNKTAQIEAATGKSITFTELLHQSCRVAAGLQGQGVAAGDLVVISCNQSILAYSLLLGTMFTGATVFLINPQLSAEIHQLTGGRAVKAVFCETGHKDCVASLSHPPALVAVTDTNHPVIASLLSNTSQFSLYNVKDVRKHIPLILFSSGTTGIPKGVQVPDLSIQRFGYSLDDETLQTYLVTSPFTWVSSVMSLISGVFKGYTLVLSNYREPRDNLNLIQQYKVNGTMMSSSRVSLLLYEPLLPTLDLSSLTIVILGGDTLLKHVVEMFITQVLGGRIGVQSIYGMTEIGAVTTWSGWNLLDLSKADSSGYLQSGVEVKVLDESGSELGPGRVGELWIKTWSMMAGYWEQPELNSQLFDKDGFFRTGDAGYFDSESFLYLSGRVDDLVNIRGTRISASDTEDVLKTHPAVLEAVVVGRPHPTDSQQLTGFVVKTPGCDITAQDIITFVADKVDEIKALKAVHFIEQLPRTTSNKIRRKFLREMTL